MPAARGAALEVRRPERLQAAAPAHRNSRRRHPTGPTVAARDPRRHLARWGTVNESGPPASTIVEPDGASGTVA
jgi:hypothetical protein